jgi:serine/threonine protein kinase
MGGARPSLKRSSLSSVPTMRRPIDPGQRTGPPKHGRAASLGHVPTVGQNLVWGVHGDLKPANLLWFPNRDDRNDMGTIKISDFGSGEFKLTTARTSAPRTRYSPPYRPPEFDLPDSELTAPSSGDIWSLGCVFLEFATWYIGGSDLLEKLDHLRSTTSQGDPDESRAFFEIAKQADESTDKITDVCVPYPYNPTAIVKPEVIKVRHSLSLRRFNDDPSTSLQADVLVRKVYGLFTPQAGVLAHDW